MSSANDAAAEAPWWQSGVIYQVYPRSFQDSNGDGVGDLTGIEARLDHLVALGVDALWLSPIYPSPMADFGYDVADYCDVDPRFGTLADLDRLIAAAHARGLKLLLDFVPNHTSSEHPWFRESRTSRDNPKRDWYIWRDAKADGSPPNNWTSDFGGSAWEWDEATGQYYLHAFLKEQPDLNWRNPAVREAMLGVLKFWLDRGVDGFRIDVLWHMIKAADLRDNPPNPAYHAGLGERDAVLQLYSTDQPEVHELARAMRALADRYPGDRVLIGEIYLPVERLMRYYGLEGPEVHLPFNFQLIGADWNARSLAAMIEAYEAALPAGGWPNWVLGNHDQPRIASRIGERQARVAAMLLLTLRGTPTLYYGDEIGMPDAVIPGTRIQDPRELREPGLGLGRDPERAPMAWDATANAGFSAAEPWLPLAAGWQVRNVAVQARGKGSMLSLHRALLALRRAHPALSIGAFKPLAAEGDVLAYAREHDGERIVVALNLGTSPQRLALTGSARSLLTATGAAARIEDGVLHLGADEGVILLMDPA